MSDTFILINTAAAILAIVLLIVKFRFSPAVALVLGSLYLGLSTGLGPAKTIETVATGFGDIMMEVGLLIAFGVLLGAMLSEMNAIQRLVGSLLKLFGPKRLPYALGLTIGTLLQAIFLDVLLVISAPLAKKIAPQIGRFGLARVATAMAISLECGIVLMVPGVASLALAGVLNVPLGTMLIWGFVVVVPTIIISIFIMSFLFMRGFWNPAKDEFQDLDALAHESAESVPALAQSSDASDAQRDGTEPALADKLYPAAPNVGVPGGLPHELHEAKMHPHDEKPLLLLFAPLLLSLVLIAGGALLNIAGIENDVLAFISDPLVALLIGVIGTSVVGRFAVGRTRVEKSVIAGYKESGQILILTGVGGSLAAAVSSAGLGDVLGKYFSPNAAAPLLIVWLMAAILHIAVGSVTISAITAAGILAPIAPLIGLNPVLIALAAGAGSLFCVQVTSNTFWLLQSLLGQTTRGTLKTVTVGVSVASVVALGCTLVLNIFL